MDSFLVDRRQERSRGACLGHAGHFRDVGTVIAVEAVGWMIDHQQVTVAAEVGVIAHYAFAVTITGVAVNARSAYVGRAQTAKRRRARFGKVVLKEHFSHLEGVEQSGFLNGRCLVFVTAGSGVDRSAQLAAGIPFFGQEVAHLSAYILIVVFTDGGNDAFRIVVIVAGSERADCK